MNHTDIQPLLADYRDLRGDERAAVDAHLAACAACARTLADYQAMDVGIQNLRDTPANPQLRTRYYAALSDEAAPPRPAPHRRALPYTLAAVAVTLVVALGVVTLLRPAGGGIPRVAPGVAQQEVPAAKSAEVGAFVWQMDGVYGYRMLRPAGWQVTDSGTSRDYLSPALDGQPGSVLHVLNLRAKVWDDMSEGLADALQAFESAPTLDGWTATLRKDQSFLSALAQIDTPDASVRLFAGDVDGRNGHRLMLVALKISDGQPLLMALESPFAPADQAAFDASGLLDDFLVMANSLTAAPIGIAEVEPWAPTATATSPAPQVTPAPTAVALEATLAPAPAPTFDMRLAIWPGWEAFDQALTGIAFGANTANPVCDWTVFGREGNSFYVWAVCAARYTAAEPGAPNLSLASFPAVLRVSDNNTAVGALKPRDGALYDEDIKTLFPPAVQQQIADNAYAAQYPALEAHARLRLTWPMLPPFGAAETALVDPDGLGAKASIRLFSGRPDPAWMMTHRDLNELDAHLRDLDPIQCPPVPDRLGYRGATVILGPGDAGTLIAADGTVWSGDAATNPDALCLADPDRGVERFLLSASQPYVDADTFNLITTLIAEPLPTPLVTPTPTPTLAPGWAAYGDEALDIQFKHPETWEIITRTPWSLVYGEKAAPQGENPALPPPFWVTVLMPNFDNADASAYNYWTPEEVNQAWDTPVGGTFTSPHAPQGYNTYTRLADTTVDGFPAILVENRSVWETPSDTRDARVLVRVGGITVAFGSYYRNEQEYVAFTRVLESVKFGSALTTSGAFALTPEPPQPAPTAAPAP